MKVYEINFAVDKFQSLLAKDDSVHERHLLDLDGSSKQQDWTQPLEVVIGNRRAPIPDIYCCDAGNMVLYGRSLIILEPIISSVAELLPIFWKGSEGRLINFVGFSQCLDTESTKWSYDDDSGKRLFIEHYAFQATKIPKLKPFKIKDQCFSIFCLDPEDGSEHFRSIIEIHGLNGLIFDTVWEN